MGLHRKKPRRVVAWLTALALSTGLGLVPVLATATIAPTAPASAIPSSETTLPADGVLSIERSGNNWTVTTDGNAWEIKYMEPGPQQIICGTNYSDPCTPSETFTVSGDCVYLQVDWGGSGSYNSSDPYVCRTDVPEEPKKVFVCKYVGTPGVDERLQTGQNPISVSINSIQNNQWDGTVPGWFSDAHDRSYVIAYDTGQPEPDVSTCPGPDSPTVVTGTYSAQVLSCEAGSKNEIQLDPVTGGVWTASSTLHGSSSLPIGEGYTGDQLNGPTGYVEYTITLADGDATDDYNVTPLSFTWTPVDPASLDCDPPPPTVQQCEVPLDPEFINDLAAMLFEDRENPSDSSNKGTHELVADGIQITTTGGGYYAKSAGYVVLDTPIPFAEIGSPLMDYVTTSGASAGLNLTIFKDGVWFGNLVYEPLFDEWWINKVVPGMPAGPNPGYQLAYGTPDDFLAAFVNAGWDVDVRAIGYSLGSNANGVGIVKSLTIGCHTFIFGLKEAEVEVPIWHDECTADSDGWILPTGVEGVVYDQVRYSNGKVKAWATVLPGYYVPDGTKLHWQKFVTDDPCPPTYDPRAELEVTCTVDGLLLKGPVTAGGLAGTYELYAITDDGQILLDSFTLAADGEYEVNELIPEDLGDGLIDIKLFGPDDTLVLFGDGVSTDCNAPPPTDPPSDKEDEEQLPPTGFDGSAALWGALLAIVVGARMAIRRRHSLV